MDTNETLQLHPCLFVFIRGLGSFDPPVRVFCRFRAGAAGLHNEIVQPGNAVLDIEQLRDVTMNDEELMREVLGALVDDTARQIELLESAIRESNSLKCVRLAHYSKGACANVGANRAAGILKQIERNAAAGQFHECTQSLAGLWQELDLLRSAALLLQ